MGAPRLGAASARGVGAGLGALDPRGVRVVGVPERLGDHRVGVVHRALDAGGDQRLAGEPVPVPDPHVDREDRGVGVGDGLVVQRRGARGALGLHGDVDPGALGGGLEGLGGHVGVRDAGGAGGDGDQPAALGGGGRRGAGRRAGGGGVGGRRRGGGRGGRLRGRRGGRGAAHGGDDLVDEVGDLLTGGRAAQAVGEPLLDQRARELGEHLEVGRVAAGRGRDQERQVGRPVLGAEVGRRGEPRERQGRYVDRGRAAVRDGDAARQPGRGRGLTGQGVLDELARVRGAPCLGHLRGEGTDHLGLVTPQRHVQADECRGDHLLGT